jgi:hypothetical protein
MAAMSPTMNISGGLPWMSGCCTIHCVDVPMA